MGEDVAYLLLHLGVPFESPRSEHIIEANRAAKAMGIRLLRVPLLMRPPHSPNHRYFFRFRDGHADEAIAIRVAESVLYGMELSFGPWGDSDFPNVVFGFPASLLKRGKPIELRTLIEVEEERPRESRITDFPHMLLSSAAYTTDNVVAAAWRISKALFRSRRHREAARFLKASQNAFYVFPSAHGEVLADTTATATSGGEQTRLEDAVINAFKIIEALIGDPPRDDRKFFEKLRAIGVDPLEPIGYRSAQPLHEIIREMNRARDRKAAHGGTPDRSLLVVDVLEYQVCARYVLVCALQAYLGEPVFNWSRRRRPSVRRTSTP